MPPERLTAALALDEYAEAFRARCHKKGIALGITRIGVHAGPAIVGNFGGGRFFDYTLWRHHQCCRAAGGGDCLTNPAWL
jgi:class 3 adenylate cyclase